MICIPLVLSVAARCHWGLLGTLIARTLLWLGLSLVCKSPPASAGHDIAVGVGLVDGSIAVVVLPLAEGWRTEDTAEERGDRDLLQLHLEGW